MTRSENEPLPRGSSVVDGRNSSSYLLLHHSGAVFRSHVRGQHISILCIVRWRQEFWLWDLNEDRTLEEDCYRGVVRATEKKPSQRNPLSSTINFTTSTNHPQACTDNPEKKNGRSNFSHHDTIWTIKEWYIHVHCYKWLHRAPLSSWSIQGAEAGCIQWNSISQALDLVCTHLNNLCRGEKLPRLTSTNLEVPQDLKFFIFCYCIQILHYILK